MDHEEFLQYSGVASGRWQAWLKHQDSFPDHSGHAEDRNITCTTCGWDTFVTEDGDVRIQFKPVSGLLDILNRLTDDAPSNTIEA